MTLSATDWLLRRASKLRATSSESGSRLYSSAVRLLRLRAFSSIYLRQRSRAKKTLSPRADYDCRTCAVLSCGKPPELAAAPSSPSIEAPLDEHVDVFTLSHRCRAGMTRRMVDQVGLIVGRTNDPKPTLAQLCRRVPRARKALSYSRPRYFAA